MQILLHFFLPAAGVKIPAMGALPYGRCEKTAFGVWNTESGNSSHLQWNVVVCTDHLSHLFLQDTLGNLNGSRLTQGWFHQLYAYSSSKSMTAGYHSRWQRVCQLSLNHWFNHSSPSLFQCREDLSYEPICEQTVQQPVQSDNWCWLVGVPSVLAVGVLISLVVHSLTKEVMVDDRLVTMQASIYLLVAMPQGLIMCFA